jgi:hypothetical protein
MRRLSPVPTIEPYSAQRRAEVLELSLRAWAPVFAAMRPVVPGRSTASRAASTSRCRGDPGHAASRASYEAVGFERWPVARYFKALAHG